MYKQNTEVFTLVADIRVKELTTEKIISLCIFLGDEKIDILNTCVDLAKTWKTTCTQKVNLSIQINFLLHDCS